MADYEQLETKVGYKFNEGQLLTTALTHPSVAHERGEPAATNQRLEFLGDAVLQLVLTQELYSKYPAFGEGALTKARAKLVNCRSLADRARELDLGHHLRLSRGEEMYGGRERLSALADAYEALLGAMFLDGGLAAAREFILRSFGPCLTELAALPLIDNPKGELQELLQAVSPEAPRYHVVATSGPDHDRLFECTVHHGGKELGRGKGKSKKAAESHAALVALQKLQEARAATHQPGEPGEPGEAVVESARE